MGNRRLILVFLIVFVGTYSMAQNYNNNINNNNNNLIINNQPVIERVKYIEKYRTVYVEKPQPKRIARTLSEPICLLGSIWVYVEDLGDFRNQSDAWEIIQHLNEKGAYGRNDWRIPSSAELTLMEENADKIGLGDGIYLATSHRNGILRPVSTGPTIEEQEKAYRLEQERITAERQRKEAERTARIKEQQRIINFGQGIKDDLIIWGTKNVGASSVYEKGDILKSYQPYGAWRLPSSSELSNFVDKASLTQKPHNGVLRKIYTYNNIILLGGRYLTSDGYFDVGTSNGLAETQGYVRLVQDIVQ